MSSNDSIEVTGATVDEATSDALERLGAQHEDVVIEVLATPRGGVLGLGARQAKVRVTRRAQTAATSGVAEPPPAPPIRPSAPPPRREPRPRVSAAQPSSQGNTPHAGEPIEHERNTQQSERPPRPQPPPHSPRTPAMEADERSSDRDLESDDQETRRSDSGEPAAPVRTSEEIDQQVHEASEALARILELMGEKAEVTRVHADSEGIELEMKGDGSGILIVRHGQTLDALEYALNRIVARKIHDAIPIMLETESYRARRRQQLHRMALSMGERAKREHAPVKLEPMPPRDRRVVHMALRDDPMITTRSSGEGFLRTIEILPAEMRERGGRGGGGGGGGRGRGRRRNEPKPQQPAIGEQGGFAKGQKRIV